MKLNVQVKIDVAKQFCKVVVPINSPTSNVEEFHLFFILSFELCAVVVSQPMRFIQDMMIANRKLFVFC